MIRKLFNKAKISLVIAIIVLTFPQLSTLGSTSVEAENHPQPSDQSTFIEVKPIDPRAQILQNYLAAKGSPMQNNAQDFIEAADKYGVDWKLVPAIAGVESTFGQAIPTGSYNAYGWGVYGSQAIYFRSWKDGIYTLNQGLKENYISKGLTDPYAMNRVYASSPAWGAHVSTILADLDQYAKKYDKKLNGNKLNDVLSLTTIAPKPAPIPSVLALK